MAKISGKDADIEYGATPTSIRGAGNEWTLAIDVDAPDSSTFDEAWDSCVEGPAKWTLDLKGIWNGAASEIDEILFGFVGGGAQALALYPEGNSSGKVKYAGDAVLVNYSVPVARSDTVKFTARFKGAGTLSRSTVT